jgi:hypothetical protein
MMYQDVKAHLEAISVLLKVLEEANSQVEALHTYGTIMVICKDLRNSAEEYNGTHNIKQVIEEIEGHAAAMADLIPTWTLPMTQHLGLAHNALRKLSMPTCFNQP